MTRIYQTFYALLTFTLFLLPLQASASEDTIATDIPELEWSELIPESWESPILIAAPDEHEESYVDPASLVSEIQNQEIKLPGFMIPVEVEDYKVLAFILVPFLDHHVQAHTHHEPNQMIYISLQEPLEITNPYQPLWVTGRIILKSVATDEGPAGYSIENAIAEAYIY